MKQKQVARQMMGQKQPLQLQCASPMNKGKGKGKSLPGKKGMLTLAPQPTKKMAKYLKQFQAREEEEEEDDDDEEEEEVSDMEEEASPVEPPQRKGNKKAGAAAGVKNGLADLLQRNMKSEDEIDEEEEEEDNDSVDEEEEDDDEEEEGDEEDDADEDGDEEEMASDQEQCEEEEEEDSADEEEAEEEAEDDEEPAEQAVAEEESDEDEAPTALPIGKTPKVKDVAIPDNYPLAKVIHVRKIASSATRMDVIESFGQFGVLTYVHLQDIKGNLQAADIAYKDEKSVKEILQSDGKWLVKGEPVEVYPKRPENRLTVAQKRDDAMKNQERTVHVKSLNIKLTDAQIKAHFEEYGEVEKVHFIKKKSIAFGFVMYKTKEMATNALKLHNTVLAGNTISVKACVNKEDMSPPQRDPKRTITVKNSQELKGIEGSVLESIFSKCGKIESMDVICRKSALAFITFTTEEAAQKAYKLDGTTEKGLLLEIASYNPDMSKTSVFVTNVGKDVVVDDLKELFSKCGEVCAVILKRGFAIIHFKDTEAFCKSFLLNESIVKNQMIFLEPHSVKKQAIFNQKKAMKRPFRPHRQNQQQQQQHHPKKNFKFQSNGTPAKRPKMNNE